MSNRRATRPLNVEAIAAANAALAGETGGRPLTMGPEDAALRKKWMDAYIAAGGKSETIEPGSKKPGDVEIPCPRANSQTRPIDDPAVQEGMRQAWEDSQADDPDNRHEEGGYIVKNDDGSLGVERWPRGAGASIAPPPRDADGKYNGKEVLGEFHTHPNPPIDENGKEWTQGGHEGDWNGIANENYPGESYIISGDDIWVVSPEGEPTRDESGEEVPLGSREDLIGN